MKNKLVPNDFDSIQTNHMTIGGGGGGGGGGGLRLLIILVL